MSDLDAPSYRVSITDGVNTVNLMTVNNRPTAIRRIPRGAGVAEKVFTQSSWSGGRGSSIVDADPDKFFDSYAAATDRPGQITPAPLVGICTAEGSSGQYNKSSVWPRPADSNAPYHTLNQTLSRAYQVTLPYSVTSTVSFFVWASFPFTSNLSLYTNNAGTVGSLVGFGSITNLSPGLTHVAFAGPLTAGVYWIQIPAAFEVITGPIAGAGTVKEFNETSWVDPVGVTRYPYMTFGVMRTASIPVTYFNYKLGLYYVNEVGEVYMNGYRGVLSHSGIQFTASPSPLWTTDEWKGCVVVITSGKYYGQSALITGNTLDSIIVSETFPTGTYEVAIHGSEKFTKRTTMAGGGLVSSVSVVGEWAYIARGNQANMVRYREYNNAGTWTLEYADDGTNRADLLKAVMRAGKKRIYRVRTDTTDSIPRTRFSRADVAATWGTNLVFGEERFIGGDGAAAVDLLDFDGTLTILTDSDVYELQDTGAGDIAFKTPGPSDRTIRDDVNGQGGTWWNTNLYFAYAEGYMRRYGRTVDDIGPNRDDGLPLNRRGFIRSAQPMFGTMAVSIDAGYSLDRYSSILTTIAPGGSWHEIFRAPRQNIPISGLFYQAIPKISNRLFFFYDNTPCFLWMPNNAQNPINDYAIQLNIQTGIMYTPVCEVTTSWIDFGSPELEKYWNKIDLYTESLGALKLRPGMGSNTGIGTITLYATTWPDQTATIGTFDISPQQRIPLNIKGNRVQFRFLIRSSNASVPVVIRSYTIDAVQMNKVTYDYSIDFAHVNHMQLLNQGEEGTSTQSVAAVVAQLEAWQENASLLTLTTTHDAINNVTGHIDPVALTPMSWASDEDSLVGNIVFRSLAG